ncbi:hypothetical protein EV644_107294 [Kribbella orskensis]|uniref:MYXO-CTERM domain-containing protein n=1 Tax=Kribbella orskensis TaxID=2512216 RepID=A0ABY2BJG9_9ACTN|nr:MULTISPECIES: hypothetical protein [Kribbella]TCN39322.1 hypothetical protein EV642_107294 [Kribbella sp. VKM Ac-2500]TCO21969.1 hypothetical protein EV644_107294 [Kribbella orskensis]
MNRTLTTLAVSALALGTIGLTATEAPARVSNDVPRNTTVMPHEPKPPNYPNYDPRYEVPPVQAATVSSAPDDNGVEVLQAGASAVGGAAIAFGAMWLYRRRQVPAT